jgi:hypothetical protein
VFRDLALAVTFIVTACNAAHAQGSSNPNGEKRGSIVIAPIPVSSPAVGSGIILVTGYVFKVNLNDTLSPPSTVGVAGALTNNGSRGGLLGGRLYFKENRYQTMFLLAKGRVNYEFFGIGHFPGRPAVPVPLQTGGNIVFAELLRKVGKNIFVGGRYQFRQLFSRIENNVQRPGGFEVPQVDLQANSAAVGMHLQRDRR